ncbi:uncharacterized protein LOC129581860 [Paramacrobiotus metropolitanus]|uniref:uncharacterized protein LOC129581860 n=1 Tax=Paramacrobiotus metropolitanus TaxID=2943436 RepID=UPI002446402B|nr:uncharacterized protein LOC129581860 [Paramacrobiotus metropolitanus]
MADNKGFVVQYFSDGTYDAYRKFHSRGPNEEDAGKNDPCFSIVFDDEPIKGKWDSTDGFFQLVPDGKRTFVGTVCFEPPVPGDVAPSGFEGAARAPDPVQHQDGSWSQVGPPLFRGLAYSGKPGERIKAV